MIASQLHTHRKVAKQRRERREHPEVVYCTRARSRTQRLTRPPRPAAHHQRHQRKKQPRNPQPKRAGIRRQRCPHRSPRLPGDLRCRNALGCHRARWGRFRGSRGRSCCVRARRIRSGGSRRARRSCGLCHRGYGLHRVPRAIPQCPTQPNLVHPSSLLRPESARGYPNRTLHTPPSADLASYPPKQVRRTQTACITYQGDS